MKSRPRQAQRKDAVKTDGRKFTGVSSQPRKAWGSQKLKEASATPSSRGLRRSTAWKTPSFWTSGLQNSKRISFCCFKSPRCGTLLWQPQEPDTLSETTWEAPGGHEEGLQRGWLPISHWRFDHFKAAGSGDVEKS